MKKIALLLASIIFIFVCVKNNISASPYSLVDRGNDFLKKKKLKEAEENYKKADAEKPETPEILFNLGNLYYNKKDYDKAIDYFGKSAIKGDNKIEEESLFRTGNSYFKKAENLMDAEFQDSIDNFKKAISFYQDLLKRQPDNESAKINIQRARLLIKQLLDKLKKQQEQQKKEGKEQQNQKDKDKQNEQNKNGENKDQQNKNKNDKNKDQQNKQDKQDKKQQEGKKQDPKKMNANQAMKELKKLQEEDKKNFKKFDDMILQGGQMRGEEWW